MTQRALRKPWLGESLFVVCALLVVLIQHAYLSAVTFWNMVPVLVFGAAWVLCKRRGRIARYSVGIGSILAMLMLLYSNLVMLLDIRETGVDPSEVSPILSYIPLYSIIIGALGCLAIYIILSIKRRRGEF